MTQHPWASGSAEILKHGLELLQKDTDTNRRLAMISIDNSVELMIKTYLGLPQRVTGLKISKNEYQEFSESFPKLLDALEKYAKSKLEGIDLGEIEWFHRLRNQLYHQGNGLTVERDKVEVYSELANVLFANLFGFRLVEPSNDETILLGEFIQAWTNFEKALSDAATTLGVNSLRRGVKTLEIVEILVRDEFISRPEYNEINQLRKIRNEVVHGNTNYKDAIGPEMSKRLNVLSGEIPRRLRKF